MLVRCLALYEHSAYTVCLLRIAILIVQNCHLLLVAAEVCCNLMLTYQAFQRHRTSKLNM